MYIANLISVYGCLKFAAEREKVRKDKLEVFKHTHLAPFASYL